MWNNSGLGGSGGMVPHAGNILVFMPQKLINEAVLHHSSCF